MCCRFCFKASRLEVPVDAALSVEDIKSQLLGKVNSNSHQSVSLFAFSIHVHSTVLLWPAVCPAFCLSACLWHANIVSEWLSRLLRNHISCYWHKGSYSLKLTLKLCHLVCMVSMWQLTFLSGVTFWSPVWFDALLKIVIYDFFLPHDTILLLYNAVYGPCPSDTCWCSVKTVEHVFTQMV